MLKTGSTLDLTQPIYSDPNAARQHREALHWPNGPVCPGCGETDRLKRAGGKSTRPGVVNCHPCRKPFTMTMGTVFRSWLAVLDQASGRLNQSRRKGDSHERSAPDIDRPGMPIKSD